MNELTKILQNQNYRVNICSNNFYLFCITYFPQFFKFPSPKFHFLWIKLFEKLAANLFKFLVLVAFRESAKTSLSKLFLVWCICYKKCRFANYVCYEKESAGDALFDIVSWLQTNKLLIEDFGHLFPEMQPIGEKRPEKKSIYNFVTSNDVKVLALGIRKSTRGKIFDTERPDLYIIDDFENNITKRSAALTRKTISFFEEFIPGLSGDAKVVFIANKISDTGSVQWLYETAESNPDWRLSEVPVMNSKGIRYWYHKFALTDKEAEERNKNIEDPKKKVISLESMKRNLNKVKPGNFEQEMLNQPLVDGERFFNIEKIDQRLAYLKTIEWQDKDQKAPNYYKRDGKWKRWGGYVDLHRYGIGADVSEGFGRDSSTIELFDFTTGKQIVEYENSRIEPNPLAVLCVDLAKEFRNCIFAPERNNIGISVIDKTKDLGYKNMYREKTIDKVTNRQIHKFGWHTNGKTKPNMLFDFQKSFENGEIEIMSRPLLLEMRAFTNYDLDVISFDDEVSNHFDRLMGAAIAWQMRKVKDIKQIIY